MPVTYFTPSVSILPPGGTNYDKVGGTVVLDPNADIFDRIDIADIVYTDITAGITPATSAWCYSYYWSAIVRCFIDDFVPFKMFGSLPNRYNLGHITLSDKFAIESDFNWSFINQRMPLRRAHFFEGNSNPGSLIPDFDPPLEGSTFSYQSISNSPGSAFALVPRANILNIFNPQAVLHDVIINYYASLVFDAYTIAISAPNAVIGIFT